MVVLLVKLIHERCANYDPAIQCRPYVHAADVDTTDYLRLRGSLDELVLGRVASTHAQDIGRNLNLRIHSITINWEQHGDTVSGSLVRMYQRDFDTQMRMLRDRGWRDILVVKFGYYATSERGSVSIPHRQNVTGVGPEGPGDAREAGDMSEEQGGNSNHPNTRTTPGPISLDQAGRNGVVSERTVAVVNAGDNDPFHDDDPFRPSYKDAEFLDRTSFTFPTHENQVVKVSTETSLWNRPQAETLKKKLFPLDHAAQPTVVNPMTSLHQGSVRPITNRQSMARSPHTPTIFSDNEEAVPSTPTRIGPGDKTQVPGAPRKVRRQSSCIGSPGTAEADREDNGESPTPTGGASA
ncbi:hypothetical protein F4678DRAFT_479269 [Xylaria arbuscula]|nr:hypothetical protein F4678DRAFT_479269 [Xylaria arbuscula]